MTKSKKNGKLFLLCFKDGALRGVPVRVGCGENLALKKARLSPGARLRPSRRKISKNWSDYDFI
jgi:hypothetical protein